MCKGTILLLVLIMTGGGSSMTPYEGYFVDIMIKLSHFGKSMSSSEGLKLINSLRKGTKIEDKML